MNEYPMGLKDLKCGDTKKPKDILPVIEGVQFENFGGEVVAKVNGKDMWFVYEVTIHGVEPLSDDHGKKSSKTKATAVKFPVDISKSTESIVEINMGRAHLAYVDTVNVRPKMHFQDPKYMKGRDVPGRTTVTIILFSLSCYIYFSAALLEKVL